MYHDTQGREIEDLEMDNMRRDQARERETSPLLKHSAKVQHLKAFIRSPFAWPGGYTLIAVMDDGECLCHECTRDNFREIVECTKHQERIGWNFIDVTINWEDPSMYCAHCDEPLTPEYCEHEQEAAAAV